jgi:hypothetical protein
LTVATFSNSKLFSALGAGLLGGIKVGFAFALAAFALAAFAA